MMDHVSIGVRDMAAARRFYDTVLATLGHKRLMDIQDFASGYGTEMPGFWIGTPQGQFQPSPGAHFAFSAANRAQVRAFYDAAVAAGAKDNGPPGPRAHYHPTYYGGFVIDPDGNKLEAVCHRPE